MESAQILRDEGDYRKLFNSCMQFRRFSLQFELLVQGNEAAGFTSHLRNRLCPNASENLTTNRNLIVRYPTEVTGVSGWRLSCYFEVCWRFQIAWKHNLECKHSIRELPLISRR